MIEENEPQIPETLPSTGNPPQPDKSNEEGQPADRPEIREEPDMDTMDQVLVKDTKPIGIGLVVLGICVLVAEVFGFRFERFIWPFFIILPGIGFLYLALKIKSQLSEPLTILSSVITVLGLMLLVMSVTGLWASWSYAWALLFPTSIGIGQIIYGRYTNKEYISKTGLHLTKIGLIIFLVGFVFFEVIFGISGIKLSIFCFPLLLIILGIYLILHNFRRRTQS
jgi:hypothetical protein